MTIETLLTIPSDCIRIINYAHVAGRMFYEIHTNFAKKRVLRRF